MPDPLRPSEYVEYRDAAADILQRHDGEEALTIFGLGDLLAAPQDGDLTAAYAFLEAQGYHRTTTPALGLLGPAGVPEAEGAQLGSSLGRTRLVGAPGWTAGTPVLVDQSEMGLVSLADPTDGIRPQADPGDDYVTVIDPTLVTSGAELVLSADQLETLRPQLVARTRLGAAAELYGVLDRLLVDATAYVQQRRQFGAAISTNQSLQHLLAWAATERHQLSSLLDIAVSQAAGGGCPDPRLAEVVKALAGRTLHTVTQTAIQVTGGISFTWEYPQHRHHRRGLVLDQLAGASADLVAGIGREVRTSGALPELFDLADAAV